MATYYACLSVAMSTSAGRERDFRDLQNNGVHRMLLDTGANRTLGSPDLNGSLEGMVPSNIFVRGAFGTDVQRGDSHGTLPAYVLANDGQPHSLQSVEMDTVPGTNQTLLSMSQLFEAGFELHLTHHGFSGMRLRDHNGNVRSEIPVYYDPVDMGWFMVYILADNEQSALNVARDNYDLIQRMLDPEIGRASLASVCITAATPFGTSGEVIGEETNSVTTCDPSMNCDCSSATYGLRDYETLCHAFPAASSEMTPSTGEADGDPVLETTGTDELGYSLDDQRSQIYMNERPVMAGVKRELKGMRRQTEKSLHERHGHVTVLPGCTLCKAVLKTSRRATHDIDPYSEKRAGVAWAMDIFAPNVVGYDGSRYINVIGDIGSGYMDAMHLSAKSDLTEAFVEFVNRIRSTFGADHDYKLVQSIVVDAAGEQREDFPRFTKACEMLGIRVIYGDPTRKTSMAVAEIRVQIHALGMKKMMLANSMLLEDWPHASRQHIWLWQRYPRGKDVRSSDGAAMAPLWYMSNGRISHRMISNELSNFVSVFTPCLISTPKTIGSDITRLDRSRWVIAWDMTGDLPIFKDPFTGAKVRTKDFVAHPPPLGMTCYEFLGLPLPDKPKASLNHPGDAGEKYKTIIDMSNVGIERGTHVPQRPVAPPPTRSYDPNGIAPAALFINKDGYLMQRDDQSSEWVPTNKHLSETVTAPGPEPEPEEPDQDKNELQLIVDAESFIGKEVYKRFIQDQEDFGVYKGYVQSVHTGSDGSRRWQVLWSDNKTTRLDQSEMHKFCNLRIDGSVSTAVLQIEDAQDAVDAIQGDDYSEPEYMQLLTEAIKKRGLSHVVTINNERFGAICKRIGIHQTNQRLYYQWLREVFKYGHEKVPRPTKKEQNAETVPYWFVDPFGNAKKSSKEFPAGVPFPIPDAEETKVMNGYHARASNLRNGQHINQMLEHIQIKEAAHRAGWAPEATTTGAKLAIDPFAVPWAESKLHTALDRWIDEMEAAVKGDDFNCSHDLRQYNVFAGEAKAVAFNQEWLKLGLPKNYTDALSRPDREWWKTAIQKELDAFDALGVMSHDHTPEDLAALGILDRSPVPLRFVFDVKRSATGQFQKYKARIVLCGHRGFMIKGVHYTDTFAAAPDVTASRTLQAIACGLKWERLCYDISTAYLQAKAELGDQIPLIYPAGMQSYDYRGRETRGLLLTQLYGHPSAAQAWSKTRDEWILSFFNDPISGCGWRCRNCLSEPCLFVFEAPDGVTSLSLIYTDDCDTVGPSMVHLDWIKQCFNDRFTSQAGPGIRDVDPSFMLGVRRTLTDRADGVREIELTMPQYIDELCKNFADHLPEKSKSTPIPEHTILGLKEPDYAPSVEEQIEFRDKGYLVAAGSILWVARQAYPEIMFTACQLASVMSKPSEFAWILAMDVIAWLRDNKEKGILYSSAGNRVPVAFYDSAHSQYHDDRRAHHCCLVHLFGGPISIDSKKHDDLGDSTPYNEYMALFHSIRRSDWVTHLLQEISYYDPTLLFFMTKDPIIHFGDNSTATVRAKEHKTTINNRHVALKYHFIRDAFLKRRIVTDFVGTADNHSDLGTKATSPGTFKKLVMRMKGYEPFWIPEHSRDHIMNTPFDGHTYLDTGDDPEYYQSHPTDDPVAETNSSRTAAAI